MPARTAAIRARSRASSTSRLPSPGPRHPAPRASPISSSTVVVRGRTEVAVAVPASGADQPDAVVDAPNQYGYRRGRRNDDDRAMKSERPATISAVPAG